MADSIRTVGELSPQNAPALGARVVYDIPRTADIESIFVLLGSSVSLSTGASGLITDGILNLITSVELLANGGRDVIASIPFAMLVNGNFARRKDGKIPAITQPGVSIATHAFSVAAHLDLSSFKTVRPKDTSLRANDYESLQLAFRFASDFNGVFTGGGFVVSASSLALTVAVNETVELADANGAYSSPVARPLKTATDLVIAGASNKVQLKLTPNQGLRAIVVKVQSNATPPVLSDTLVSRFRCNVGKVQRADIASATLKGKMSNAYDDAWPTGYFVLDFADRMGADDHLSDCVDLDSAVTRGADSIFEIDTTGACTVTVMQDGYIPLAK